MFSFLKKKSLLNCSDQTIMRKWRELLDKLEGRKNLLSGFKNTMNMFREIENIQEELKEIEVRSPGLFVLWQNMSKFWNFMIFFLAISMSFWMKVLFLLHQSPNSEELRDFENMWNFLKKRSGVALGTIGRKKIS